MKPGGRSRTEWRCGGRRQGASPEVKSRTTRRTSCSPLRRRRKSPSPEAIAETSNRHDLSKGILKSALQGSQEGTNKRDVSAETGSQFRSKTPARRWGQARHREENHSRQRMKRSPSPYQGSRKGISPGRWPRGKRVGESGRQEEPEMTDGDLRLGRDERFMEEQRTDLAREHWGGTRRRSPLREGQKCRPAGHHYQNTDEGDRKVYVSWNKFVTKSFLHAHFERFGGLEYIYIAHGGHFYGFVTFVNPEVGRSLIGEVHNVEGVELLIKRAKPDTTRAWNREGRDYGVRSEVCAFFKEGRCLRGVRCEFLHIGESPRTSREFSSKSLRRRRSRSDEQDEVELGEHSINSVRRSKVSRKEDTASDQSKSGSLHEGPIERDGRLRPPPPTRERKRKAPQQDSPEREFRSREDQSKEKSGGDTGHGQETRRRSGAGKEGDVLDTKNMEKEAMAKRIKELEEALKEKEEAEERKRRFLMLDRKVKTRKGDTKKSTDERFSGSKKNCRLIEKFSRKFKATKESTSTSNNEGNDGDASSTSDCNTASPSPPPRAISDKSSPGPQEIESGRAEMREKIESQANLSLEEHVEGSSGYDQGNEGKTERLDLEKNKGEGEEIRSAEEVDFEMGKNSIGSKDGASGDEGQESLGTKETVEDNELELQQFEETVQEALI